MALTHYLAQIENPQVAFAVKQQKNQFTNLDSVVSTTLEMESHLASKNTIAVVESEAMSTTMVTTTNEGTEAIAAVDTKTGLMKELLQRMGKLETELSATKERTSLQSECHSKDDKGARGTDHSL